MYTLKNIIFDKYCRSLSKMTISPDILQSNLQQRHEARESLRAIAVSFGNPITHGDIGRILQGVFPVGDKKRVVLDIPPVCPTCYQVLPKPPRQVPAWVEEAMQNLRKLEAAANVAPEKDRVYARGGKRVHIARAKKGHLIGDSSPFY
jgi:hypothetical protein